MPGQRTTDTRGGSGGTRAGAKTRGRGFACENGTGTTTLSPCQRVRAADAAHAAAARRTSAKAPVMRAYARLAAHARHARSLCLRGQARYPRRASSGVHDAPSVLDRRPLLRAFAVESSAGLQNSSGSLVSKATLLLQPFSGVRGRGQAQKERLAPKHPSKERGQSTDHGSGNARQLARSTADSSESGEQPLRRLRAFPLPRPAASAWISACPLAALPWRGGTRSIRRTLCGRPQGGAPRVPDSQLRVQRRCTACAGAGGARDAVLVRAFGSLGGCAFARQARPQRNRRARARLANVARAQVQRARAPPSGACACCSRARVRPALATHGSGRCIRRDEAGCCP